MARPVRISSDLVRLRADEIRAAGKYRGRTVHVGSRPPVGTIAFTRAVALRLGCSVTLVKRVLAGRSRSGPRRPLEERVRSASASMSQDELSKAWNTLVDHLARSKSPATQAALTIFADEGLSISERLAPLLALLVSPEPTEKRATIQRAENALWSKAVPTSGLTATTRHQPVKATSTMVREALVDSLDASLGTTGSLTVQEKETAEILSRMLQVKRINNNGS